jgi:hypothetical protein
MSKANVTELRVDDHMKQGDIEDSKMPADYRSDSNMSPVSSNTGEKAQHNTGIDAEVANFFAAQGQKEIGEQIGGCTSENMQLMALRQSSTRLQTSG